MTKRQPPDILLLSAATGGGVRRTQELLANGMVAAGQHVVVANPLAGAPFFDQLDPSVDFVKLADKRNPLAYFASIKRTLKRLQPNVVIASQDQTIAPLAVLRSLGLVSTPLIGCIHNNPVVHKSARNPLSRLLPFMARHTYQRMDRLVAVSQTLGQHLETAGYASQGQVQRIYNPVLHTADLNRPKLTERPLAGSYILAAGNLNAQKDHGVLLGAFAEIASDYPGDLVILGEGPRRAKLLDQARALRLEKRFHLPGFVQPTAWFAHADAFVLSSAWEGFGLVLVEAMAQGIPVLSTECNFGPRELLQDGAIGPLSPVGDAVALGRNLRSVLSTPVLAQTLRRRAADFTVEAAVESYLELAASLR